METAAPRQAHPAEYDIIARLLRPPLAGRFSLSPLVPIAAAFACVDLFFQLDGANPFAVKNELYGLAAAVSAFLFLLGRPDAVRLPRLPAAASLAFVFAGCLSLASARTPVLALSPASHGAAGFAVFLLVYNHADQAALLSVFRKALVATGVAVSVYGIKQYLFPGVLDPGYLAPGKMKVYSCLGNPNYLAVFLLASLAASWAEFESAPGSSRRAGLLIAGAVQLACLAATRSRAGYLGAIVLAAWPLLDRGKEWCLRGLRLRIAVPLGLCLLSALLLLLRDAAANALTTASFHTIRGRVFIWLTSLAMYLDHPFTGVGLGNYEIGFIAHQASLLSKKAFASFSGNAGLVSNAHNEFLHALVETGPLGCAAFCALAVSILRHGFTAASASPCLAPLAAGFTALTVVSLFMNQLHYAPLALNYWAMAGFLCRGGKAGEWTVSLSSSSRRAGLLSAALAAGLGMRSSLLMMASNRLERGADVLTEQSRFPDAVALFGRAESAAPRNGYLLEKSALALFLGGDGDSALRKLAKAERFSGDIGIPYLRAEILARRKDYDAAAAIYEFIGRAYPTHITPHFMLGQIRMQQGRHAEARREFIAVLRIEPSPYNLKLDRAKTAKQKEIAAYLLRGLGGR